MSLFNWVTSLFKPKDRLQEIKAIIEQQFPVVNVNREEDILLVKVGNPLVTSVWVGDDQLRIESTLVFDGNIANLKTLSTMSHGCTSRGIAMSGLVTADNQNLKTYLVKDVDIKVMEDRLLPELENMKVCLESVVAYIEQRSEHFKLSEVDLSMFENIDVLNFNPRTLGERKEFIHQTWNQFAKVVNESSSNDLTDAYSTIDELRACAEFEHKNQMLLAEVGDIVLSELIIGQQIGDAVSEGNFQVH